MHYYKLYMSSKIYTRVFFLSFSSTTITDKLPQNTGRKKGGKEKDKLE